MSLLRGVIPSLISKTIKSGIHLQLIHTKSTINNVVSAICDSLRSGWNWDALTRKFDSIELDELLVEKVLLELKEPMDAKRALGFFHWSSSTKSFQHGLRSYSIAIHILVGARLTLDARALLESVVKRNAGNSCRFSVVDSLLSSYELTASNPFVFDMLVQAYARLRMFDIGYDVCCYLDERGFSPSLTSFNTLIHVVQKSCHNILVWKIYEHMITRGVYPNTETVRILINALCKEGRLQECVDILDRIHGKRCSPSVIVNASLVLRVLEECRIEDSMTLLKRMLRKNMVLDTIAYSLIVYAKIKIGHLESTLEVFEEMLKRGFQPNPFVYTSFIGAHCKDGRIEVAYRVMQKMENMGLKPYDETYNFLIEGSAKAGRLEEMLRNFEKMMERGMTPSCSAFSQMVGKLCENGDVEEANARLTTLLERGFVADEITFSFLIDGYAKKGEIQEVLKLYYEMEYKSLSPGVPIFSTLIKSLCQCGKLEEAEKYLGIMKDRSLAPSEYLYETLIAGYIEKGNKERAVFLYNDMVSKGLRPNCSYFCDGGTQILNGCFSV